MRRGYVKNHLYETVATSSLSLLTQELVAYRWRMDFVQPDLHLMTLAITLGTLEIVPYAVEWIARLFPHKSNLDTAMIPEIIYHEFAHVGFSQYLELGKQTPLSEGVANYFASSITDYHKVLHKGGKFSKGLKGKNAKALSKYDWSFEAIEAAQHSFTFKYLWLIQESFGKEQGKELIFAQFKN